MKLVVDGIDLTPYVEEGGMEHSRNDIDGDGAGRTMDGTMYRDRVTVKDKWTVKCRPLTQFESQIVLNAIFPEYVTVTTISPREGEKTAVFYSNNVPATHQRTQEDGTEKWEGIQFPLIER